jgi:SNF2 family DNA or RNA helicase
MENPPFVYVKPPFDHQRREFESTRDFQYFAHFWEMGLGKSKIVIDTAQHLYLSGKIDSMIITAEKGYYLNWLVEEFPKHWPETLPIRIRAYSAVLPAKKKLELDQILTPTPGVLDVLLLNIESISSKSMGGFFFTKLFADNHKSTMMVIDESTTIKNPKAGRTKNAIYLGKRCTYRRILTGTPITQSPIDLYSQTEFLKSGLLGFGSYTSFRSFYSIMQTVNLGPRSFQTIVGYRELDDLARRCQHFSSRLEKKDCLTLPEKIYSKIYVEPTKEQERVMEDLSRECMSMMTGGAITVTNALGLLTKAQQIAGGHVKDDDGKVRRVPSNKPQALQDCVSNIPIDKKIIVWGYFQEDMLVIKEALADICPVFEVSGQTEIDDRATAIQQFRAHKGRCVFLASPRVAGKSLTLNEAEYVIYYSNSFNLEHRLQSEDRNHRIGQTSAVNYYDLICLGTPDVKVVAALHTKQVISKTVLDNIQSFFNSGYSQV